MSPAASGDRPPLRQRFRQQYTAELVELRLQTEVMAGLVLHALERMRAVLAEGGPARADEAIGADDAIDAMNARLTERCYDVLAREAPVASDLRLVVSVIRCSAELERIGDLSLRVVKAGVDHDLLASDPEVHRRLVEMADLDVTGFGQAFAAWERQDLELARRLASGCSPTEVLAAEVTTALLAARASEPVRLALVALPAMHALQRIGDHVALLGRRLTYLLTGDPRELAAEAR